MNRSILGLCLLVLLLAATARAADSKDSPGDKEFTNSIGMKLVPIPPGKFMMGSPKEEKQRNDDEEHHEVEITRPFHMGVHEVTQEEYQRVMGTNPSYFSATGDGKDKVKGMDTGKFPVEQVSWEDAVAFCRKLSELPEEKKAGRVYRLPTAAEWEYACREGGKRTSPFHFGDSLSSEQANFNGNEPYGGALKGPNLERTSKVGNYQVNAFGLHDMHGNVWEWCSDWYGKDYPKENKDPQGPQVGVSRVVRGGCWGMGGRFCRSSARWDIVPSNRTESFGFRAVVVPVARTP